MKHFLAFILFICISVFSIAQSEIKGVVKDATTGESIIGAAVMVAEGKGIVTDIDGNFKIKVEDGEYNVTISFVGYEPQKIKVKVAGQPVTLNFVLQTKTLNEVEVVADVARTRETPVAFSNVTTKQIQEELGTRDLPMVLNSTPGAYATEQGGGSGDARINIRGFDQRYVAVMVDGVPVNDMETGQVYWSNWDGLSDITRSMQVQRGLGASKLAVPSVGGTINILTKGIDQKMSAVIKQEVTSYGLYKTSFGFNSGQLKDGWGVTVAGSRKQGTEWADGTYTDAWSYFGKVQKRFKKQLFSISANGAPQSHGQRFTRMPIAIYDKKTAIDLGINVDSVYKHTPLYTTGFQGERGLKYNPDWGTLNGKAFSCEMNYFHKPAFNLSHFWTPNDKITVSTIAYLSIGTGGGSYLKNAGPKDTTTGTINIQAIYDGNITANPNTYYNPTEHPSTNYLLSNVNKHLWYGALSSCDYKINKNLSALFGVDVRYYKGTHYQTAYDLLGGDYMIDGSSDKNQPTFSYIGDPNAQFSVKRVGDKTIFYNDNQVMWGGLFGQAEYKRNDKWTTFISASISDKSYQRRDYFAKRDLIIDGNTFSQVVGYGDEFYYNGSEHLTAINGTSAVNGTSTVATAGDTTFIGTGVNRKYILNAKRYTNDSPEARTATTDRKWIMGYTIKGGANYNINEHYNAFVNLGHLNMAPYMNAVFDNYNHEYAEIKNQTVNAIEGGCGMKYSNFNVSANLYYTYWENKPYSSSVVTPDGTISYNINGMNAVHKGIELSYIYKVLKNLELEGIVSIADWRTISAEKVYISDANNNLIDSVDFSAKNVHVGDAAQIQFGSSIRYEIIKGLYLKPRFTYFGKHYANFNPTTLVSTNKDRESWKMPSYGLLDLFAGYDFHYWKMKFGVSAGLTNILDVVYITDGLNGSKFDATTATVYMGMGRRFTVALRIGF